MNNQSSSLLTFTDSLRLLEIDTPNPTAGEIEAAHGARLRDWRFRHRFADKRPDRERAEDMFKLLPEARRVALAHISGRRSRTHTSNQRPPVAANSVPTWYTPAPAIFSSATVTTMAGRIWDFLCRATREFLRHAGSPGQRVLNTMHFFQAAGISKPFLWIIIMAGWLTLLNGCLLAFNHHH
jgi:hypothetical protein